MSAIIRASEINLDRCGALTPTIGNPKQRLSRTRTRGEGSSLLGWPLTVTSLPLTCFLVGMMDQYRCERSTYGLSLSACGWTSGSDRDPFAVEIENARLGISVSLLLKDHISAGNHSGLRTWPLDGQSPVQLAKFFVQTVYSVRVDEKYLGENRKNYGRRREEGLIPDGQQIC